jgi:hypothetical protein
MPARFDDWLPYSGDDVVAIGPLHSGDKLKEVCAWVYQSTSVQGEDAAATEMHFEGDHAHPPTAHEGADPNDHPDFQQVEGVRWLLPLRKISRTAFEPGPAFAVAIALVVDMSAPNNERVVWWGQPVDLFKDEQSVQDAKAKGALLKPPLQAAADPAPPHPAD